MFIEKFNRFLNEVSDIKKEEELLIFINGLLDFVLGKEEKFDKNLFIKEKINKIKEVNKNLAINNIEKLLKFVKREYRKEIENLKKNIETLIKNQRKISVLKEKFLDDKMLLKILEKIEKINKKEGNLLVNEYLSLIKIFEEKIKKIEKNIEIFKKDKKADLYSLKLFLYHVYFDLKLLDESFKEKKGKINEKIEKINSELLYFEKKFEKKLRIKREALF